MLFLAAFYQPVRHRILSMIWVSVFIIVMPSVTSVAVRGDGSPYYAM